MIKRIAFLTVWAFLLSNFPSHAQEATEEKKPEEAKPVETKPVETKPVETKPDETKPDEAKTDENGEKKEDEILAGHSFHGEAFNEGPRQKAYVMGGTGDISFPITTKNDVVQQLINQGVGQLHGFWTLEAERSFRQAAAIEPECAMAYWGAALTVKGNEKRAKGFIAEAVKRKDKVSERERMYIDALDAYIKAGNAKKKERAEKYTKALEDIMLKFPDDLEAKAFLALQLYQNKSAGIPITSYFAVDAVIKQIIEVKPLHPAHHFRIHLWDYRNASQALTSAAKCGQGSPGIAHMWHMPGHIYSRLQRYHDAAWQQEASARVDHAHMIRDRVMPDQIGNFAHNNEWLIRNLIYIGRAHDAMDLAKNMISLPRHPKYNTIKRGSTSYGRMRLFDVLDKFEQWEETIALCNSTYLEATEDDDQQVKRLRYLGAAYFHVGDIANGDLQLTDLQVRLEKKTKERDEAGTKAEEKAKMEKKKEADIKKAKTNATKTFGTKIRNLERSIASLEGWKAVAQKDFKTGSEKLAKGIADPLHVAMVQFAAGDKDKAIEKARSQVKSQKNQVLPLAYLAHMLWNAEKQDEAKKTLEDLRKISSAIDIDMKPFTRLAPIVQAMALPEDWRVEKVAAKDVGVRPDLETLGPFRWHTSAAPEWQLKNHEDKLITSKQFQGQPHVLIFYLGFGCLHCAEQLQAFGPVMKDFEAAGIKMQAISTDELDGLKKSIENYDGGPMPIPIVANPELNIFKAFRVFDDFENQPLHGTFIIDGKGQVLWQDISYQPFMDHKFVLKEAKRLLSQQSTEPVTVSAASE